MSGLPEHVRMLPNWLSKHERNHLDNHTPADGWVLGQQETGYYKRDITQIGAMRGMVARALEELDHPTLYDAWLLHYPTASSIPKHEDPRMAGMNHIRLNAIVTQGVGGLLRISGVEVPTNVCDAYIFRPDEQEHEVTPIEIGSRLVFSVGANVPPEHAKRLGLA